MILSDLRASSLSHCFFSTLPLPPALAGPGASCCFHCTEGRDGAVELEAAAASGATSAADVDACLRFPLELAAALELRGARNSRTAGEANSRLLDSICGAYVRQIGVGAALSCTHYGQLPYSVQAMELRSSSSWKERAKQNSLVPSERPPSARLAGMSTLRRAGLCSGSRLGLARQPDRRTTREHFCQLYSRSQR